MDVITIDTNAVSKIKAAIADGRLKSGSWGGVETVCAMSAMVRGAQSVEDCVTEGWPSWLADLIVYLFDANVGAADEEAARNEFALAVARSVQVPRDYDRARDLFLIRRLDTGDYSALKSLRKKRVDADWWRNCEAAIVTVADLLRRRLDGDSIGDDDFAAARAAAYAAARAAADAAAYAAAAAARAAAYAAASGVAYAAAAAAADAAAYATAAAARAALINAIKGA